MYVINSSIQISPWGLKSVSTFTGINLPLPLWDRYIKKKYWAPASKIFTNFLLPFEITIIFRKKCTNSLGRLQGGQERYDLWPARSVQSELYRLSGPNQCSTIRYSQNNTWNPGSYCSPVFKTCLWNYAFRNLLENIHIFSFLFHFPLECLSL